MDKKIERSGLQKHLKKPLWLGLLGIAAAAVAFNNTASSGRSQT